MYSLGVIILSNVMFLENQPHSQRQYYVEMLTILGSLSGLFSESESPYLYYRVTEHLFCKSFEAEDLSRGDTSADASKDGLGVGIKTFLAGNKSSLQKIAEFNSEHPSFSSLPPDQMVRRVSELRNQRIRSTKRMHNLKDIIYHCITRKPGSLVIFEEQMHEIDVNNIHMVVVRNRTISFTDGINDYSFYIPKSTLSKKFKLINPTLEIPVQVLPDPFGVIRNLLTLDSSTKFQETQQSLKNNFITDVIFLPLYGYEKGVKKVFEKSGLNQWNASGRKRNLDEVYIPIPSWIHTEFPDFFPPKDVKFKLKLPNQSLMDAKVCQAGSKALMSNPNSALGKWLLRDVLNLSEGEPITYQHLEEIGLDSVMLTKHTDSLYEIDFKRIGQYEEFLREHEV